MRVPIIAGNWKMNKTVSESIQLVEDMKQGLEDIKGVDMVVCPPFVSLYQVAKSLEASSVSVGAQNLFYEEKGAYTGEISPNMLAGICSHVIVGHSERRAHFGETDEMVNRKVKAAVAAGLKPIVCVGETLDEMEKGHTEEVVTRQVRAALDGLSSVEDVVMAYEPVWAIGTGKAATEKQANETIGLVRRIIAESFGPSAEEMRIQYGGSANAENIASLMSQPEIDGALVGGASLKADRFVSMVKQTASVKGLL